MSDLLEHILDQDYISANDLFESKMVELQEKKLYEKKRIMQAEVFGGLSPEEIAARKKMGYRKASDVLGDPDVAKKKMIAAAKKKMMAAEKKRKKVSEETLDEAGLAPSSWRARAYRTGLRAIRDVEKEKDSSAETGSEKQASDLRKSHRVERPEDKKKVGVVRRNWNTFRGREPDYVKKDTSKGGRVGKVARKALQVVAGTLASAE